MASIEISAACKALVARAPSQVRLPRRHRPSKFRHVHNTPSPKELTLHLMLGTDRNYEIVPTKTYTDRHLETADHKSSHYDL